MIARQLRSHHEAGELGRFLFLASDLDGTLLNARGEVTGATIAALARAKGAGVRAAIATARPLRLVTPLLSEQLRSVLDAVIVTNGAAIYDAASGSLLHEDLLPSAQARTAMQLIRSLWPDAVFGWETGGEFWSEADFLEFSRGGGVLRDPAEDRLALAPVAGVHQLVFAVPGLAAAECVSAAAAVLGEGVSVTESHGGVVELSAPHITKGAAVGNWIRARSLEHSIADAVAFGDGHNDLTMLRAAGAGVAMGNAAEEIRSQARFVTSSNHSDGVAEFIEAYLDLSGAGAGAGAGAGSGASVAGAGADAGTAGAGAGGAL